MNWKQLDHYTFLGNCPPISFYPSNSNYVSFTIHTALQFVFKWKYLLLYEDAKLLPKKFFWEPLGPLKSKVRSPSHISRIPLTGKLKWVKDARNLIHTSWNSIRLSFQFNEKCLFVYFYQQKFFAYSRQPVYYVFISKAQNKQGIPLFVYWK